jgi:AraC family transcriptional regulator
MPILTLDNKYSSKLNRVLNFAHFQGDKTLQIENLATVACLSKFHFSRVFQDTIGESPARFLRRIRLEKAASLLKNDCKLSVQEISERCGFSTNQFFTRLFGNQYGKPPSRFREIYLNRLKDNTQTASAKLINNNFKDIRQWAKQHNLWTWNSEIIGITWDYSSITPNGFCRYDAAIAIPTELSPSSNISVQTIPGGLYATVKLPYKHISDLTKIWWWFSLTIKTSNKFSNFTANLNIGPWYEVHRSISSSVFPIIELFVRLKQIENHTPNPTG